MTYVQLHALTCRCDDALVCARGGGGHAHATVGMHRTRPNMQVFLVMCFSRCLHTAQDNWKPTPSESFDQTARIDALVAEVGSLETDLENFLKKRTEVRVALLLLFKVPMLHVPACQHAGVLFPA